MGLLQNLRVLLTSSIGDDYVALVAEVRRLRQEQSDASELCESRYRRQNKRDRDDARINGTAVEQGRNGTLHPQVAAVAARRARRAGGGGALLGG